MDSVSEEYIKQLGSSFHKFVLLIAKDSWITTVNIEELKTTFKLANFIETCSQQLKERQCLEDFLLVLKNQHSICDDKDYEQDVFLKAGDALLSSLFYHETMTANKLDVAVMMYIALFGNERFEDFIAKYILETSSSEAILDFTAANKDHIDCQSLRHTLYLHELHTRFKLEEDKLKEFITSSLSPYKVEHNLDIVIGVLSLEEVEDKYQPIRKLILDTVLSKMYDRSVISKPFWLSLFKTVNKSNIVKTCKNFGTFFELFFSFIRYLGSMMENKTANSESVWCTNSTMSICPEISYNEVIDMIKHLFSDDSIKEYVRDKLIETSNQTNCAIWEDIQSVIFYACH